MIGEGRAEYKEEGGGEGGGGRGVLPFFGRPNEWELTLHVWC